MDLPRSPRCILQRTRSGVGTINTSIFSLIPLFGLPVLLALLWKSSRGYKVARDLVRTQYEVLDDSEIAAFRDSMPSEDYRLRFDPLIAKVKVATGGVIRKGHLFWLSQAVEVGYDGSKIMTFTPPPERPYSLEEDFGFIAVRAYVQATLDGVDPGEAVQAVRIAATKGSLVAMIQLGTALMQGMPDFGMTDRQEGRRLLEAAVKTGRVSSAHATLGSNLLDLSTDPVDRHKGLALLEQAFTLNPGNHLAFEIGAIHFYGLHGFKIDRALGRAWGLKAASSWRRCLDRLGLSQQKWVEARLELVRKASWRAATMKPEQSLEMLRREREQLRRARRG